jgi:hypothetical protein
MKPTVYRFSRKQSGHPLENFEISDPGVELTPSEALSWFQSQVDELNLDEPVLVARWADSVEGCLLMVTALQDAEATATSDG